MSSVSITGYQQKKSVDVNINETDISTAKLILLNGLKKGTSSYERIGNSVNPHSLKITGSIGPTEGLTFPGPILRCAVVLAISPNQQAPTYEAIFQGNNNAGTAINGVTVAPNVSGKEIFKILRDDVVQLGYIGTNGNALVSTSPACYTINIFLKLKNIMDRTSGDTKTVYTTVGDTGLITDITSRALYIIFYSSQKLAVNATSRFTYTDN